MRAGDEERTVALEDIDTLLIENHRAVISMATICSLAEHRISALFSDGKHMPRAWLLATHKHSRQLISTNLLRRQSQPVKKRIWQRIIKQKIINQSAVADRHSNTQLGRYLLRCASKVASGDASGQEAIAAAEYFRRLWPSTRRDPECLHNAMANFGYAVIRSSLARYLVVYGFDLSSGVHHSSVQNPENLVDDLLEPYRPFVDDAVLKYFESGADSDEEQLTPEIKIGLLQALQGDVGLSGSRVGEVCQLMDATRLTVDSLKSLLESAGLADALILPTFT